MHTIYVTIWICWALAIVEAIVWVIYMIYVCSNRVNRHHMKEHLEDDKQNLNYKQVPQQPPSMGQPVMQQPMMQQPMMQQPMMQQPMMQQPMMQQPMMQ